MKSSSQLKEKKTMTKLIFGSTRFLKLAALLMTAGLLGLGAMKVYSGNQDSAQAIDRERQEDDGQKGEKPETAEKYLFVWAGDQARTNPDFLAVVNFDESSANYGKVMTTVPLPAPG